MANRIRELRKSRKITMKKLGELLGYSEVCVSQYETGKRQPNNEALFKFADFFGVSVDYLLGRTDIPNMESLQLFAEPAEKNQPPKLETEDARVAEFYEILGRLSSSGIDKALDIMRMVELSDKPNKP